jgi:hypothetical protein
VESSEAKPEGASTMTDDNSKPVVLDIETLNAVAARAV